MMNFLLLSFFLLGPTSAQSPHPNLSQTPDPIQRLYWEALSSAAWRNQTSAQTEMANRMEAQGKEREFLLKAQKFIQKWHVLVREYNQKGGFNMKKAKEVSKAFHDLEKSEGWPKAEADPR
jgi:hypothetical protein